MAGYAVECGLKACVVVYVRKNANVIFREKKFSEKCLSGRHADDERGAAMDQEPLVIEKIEAGRKFIDELDKHVPVRAAFWLKIHVASDRVTDENIDAAYREVGRIGRTIDDPNFDLFQVKMIGVNDPFARAASDLYTRSKARVPTHIRGRSFGGMSVEGVYVYPPPLAVVSK